MTIRQFQGPDTWYTIVAETPTAYFCTSDQTDAVFAKWYVDLVLGEEGTENEIEIVFEQDALDEIEAYTAGLEVTGELIGVPGDVGFTKYMARFFGPYHELARLMTRHRDGGTLLEDNEYEVGMVDKDRNYMVDNGHVGAQI